MFANERILKKRNEVFGLPESVKEHVYEVSISTGRSGEDTVMDSSAAYDNEVKTYTISTSIREIAKLNYAIVYKALCKYPVFKFNILKSYFPSLNSTREFINSDEYLGGIQLRITSRCENAVPEILYKACLITAEKISAGILKIEETYEGSREFKARKINEVFKEKKCSYTDPHDGGVGISQNDSTVPPDWKLDLSKEDWFAFEDNFGTSEEKAFVACFKTYVNSLKQKYDKVYLVRNERQLAIYSFASGERFEPDYILFLHSPKQDGYEQLQVFIEPKGTNLVSDKDSWKEKFLLEIKENAIPVTELADNNKYKIWGFHFFNREVRSKDFKEDMESL